MTRLSFTGQVSRQSVAHHLTNPLPLAISYGAQRIQLLGRESNGVDGAGPGRSLDPHRLPFPLFLVGLVIGRKLPFPL